VLVDVEMVVFALLDAPQGGELRQHHRRRAHPVHELDAAQRGRRADDVPKLREQPLGSHPRQLGGVGPRGGRRVGLDLQPELAGQAGRPQHPQRIVGEALLAHHSQPAGLEVGLPAMGIEQRTAVERLGERVDREVAAGEVLLDAGLQRHEVDVPGAVRGQDPPCRVLLGQAEGASVARAGQHAGQGAGVRGDHQVEVDRRPSQEPVAHRPAHHPGRRPRQRRPGRPLGFAHAGSPSRW
jgi:hypothetical protein